MQVTPPDPAKWQLLVETVWVLLGSLLSPVCSLHSLVNESNPGQQTLLGFTWCFPLLAGSLARTRPRCNLDQAALGFQELLPRGLEAITASVRRGGLKEISRSGQG